MIAAKLLKSIFTIGAAISIAACSITPANNDRLTGEYSDLSSFEIKVGQAPTDFVLESATGEQVSLYKTLDENHVLLMFYRGDWCPYCIDQFSTIQPVLPQLKKYGVKLLAVSPDQKAAAMNTQRQFGTDYTFLTDPELAVTKQYGIQSEQGLPHPAVFLIERGNKPKILWFYASTDHKTRPTGEQLLTQIKALLSVSEQ